MLPCINLFWHTRLGACHAAFGDTIFAALFAFGHHICKILAHLSAWLAPIVGAILNAFYHPGRQYNAVTSA